MVIPTAHQRLGLLFGQKKQKNKRRAFLALGGHQLLVSLLFVVYEVGEPQDNDSVEMCTVVFLEFAQFQTDLFDNLYNAFYIFQNQKNWYPMMLNFDPYESFRISNLIWYPYESSGFLGVQFCFKRPKDLPVELAFFFGQTISRCGHQARGNWGDGWAKWGCFFGSILGNFPSSPRFLLLKQKRNSDDLEDFVESLMS